jgi:cell fate (sporulation/competence/biofilm development) regulator YmcA (YheA/YmcA/DUF963 family)
MIEIENLINILCVYIFFFEKMNSIEQDYVAYFAQCLKYSEDDVIRNQYNLISKEVVEYLIFNKSTIGSGFVIQDFINDIYDLEISGVLGFYPNLLEFEDVVLKILKKSSGWVIYYKHKENLLFIEKCLSLDIDIFQYLSFEIRNNKGIAMKFLKLDGVNIWHCSESLKDDIDIAKAAIDCNYDYFRHVSDRLKNEPDIIKYALNKGKYILHYVGNEYKKPEEYTKLLKDNIGSQPDLIKTFKGNQYITQKDMILYGINKTPKVLQYTEDGFRLNKDFVIDLILSDVNIMSYISNDLKEDENYMKLVFEKLITIDGFNEMGRITFINNISSKFKKNNAFLNYLGDKDTKIKEIKEFKYMLYLTTEEYKKSDAYKKTDEYATYIQENIVSQPELIKTFPGSYSKSKKQMVKIGISKGAPIVIEYAGPEYYSNPKFVEKTLLKDIDLVKYVDKELFNNEELMKDWLLKENSFKKKGTRKPIIDNLGEDLKKNVAFLNYLAEKDSKLKEYLLSKKLISDIQQLDNN